MGQQPTTTLLEMVLGGVMFAATLPAEYAYLKYVDLGQFAKEFGKFIVRSAGLCIVVYVVWLFHDSMNRIERELPALSAIPDFAWFIFWIAQITWILGRSGESIQLPKWNVRQWLVINIIVALTAGVIFLSSDVALRPIQGYFLATIWMGTLLYRRLVQIGEVSYKLRQMLLDSQSASVDNSA